MRWKTVALVAIMAFLAIHDLCVAEPQYAKKWDEYEDGYSKHHPRPRVRGEHARVCLQDDNLAADSVCYVSPSPTCNFDGTGTKIQDNLWSVAGANLQDRTPQSKGGPNLIINGDFSFNTAGVDQNGADVLWGLTRDVNDPETFKGVTQGFLQSWPASGGGNWTYAVWGGMVSTLPVGECRGCSPSMIYFGNGFGSYSNTGAPFTFNRDGFAQSATLMLIPQQDNPVGGYGTPDTPVTVSQAVGGLTPGTRYRLQFFVGSEGGSSTSTKYTETGVAAVDITGYARTYFSVLHLDSRHLTLDFVATKAYTTISFLSWGHINILNAPAPGLATELVLDDVILTECRDWTNSPFYLRTPFQCTNCRGGPGPSDGSRRDGDMGKIRPALIDPMGDWSYCEFQSIGGPVTPSDSWQWSNIIVNRASTVIGSCHFASACGVFPAGSTITLQADSFVIDEIYSSSNTYVPCATPFKRIFASISQDSVTKAAENATMAETASMQRGYGNHQQVPRNTQIPNPLHKGYAYVISGTITSATGVEDCCVGGRFQYVPFFETNQTFTDPTTIANELASSPNVPIVNPGTYQFYVDKEAPAMEYWETVENGGDAGEPDAPYGYEHEAPNSSDGSYAPPPSQRYYHDEPHDATSYPPSHSGYAEEPSSRYGKESKRSSPHSLRDEHSYRGAVESPTEAYTPKDSYKQEPDEGDDTKRLQQGSNNKPKRNSYHARYVPDQRPMVEDVAGEGHKPRYAPKGDAGVSKSHVRKHYKRHNDE